MSSIALFVLLALSTVFASGTERRALAQGEAHEGVGESALCGLATVAAPVCRERLAIAATTGYGYTESLGTVPGAHHRLLGTLAVGVVPLPWLALGLRLDGRLDLHPEDQRGRDYTGTGDPRLVLRAGKALGRTALGGEAVVWVPGGNAPSFEARATTLDLKALVSHQLATVRLLANLGMRIDQSEKSAPSDLSRVRPGDRVALGLSDAHALLLAIGASGPLPRRTEWFAEAALDWLLGANAPSFGSSPLRITLGARAFFSERLSAELSATASTQQRPSLGVDAPLVPIEPRIGARFGLRYAFDLHPPPPPADVREEEEPPPPPEEPTTATITGILLDEQGAALPDVRVKLEAGETKRETITDAEGRYTFHEAPVGPAVLESEATGFADARWELDVRPHMEPLPPRGLTAKGDVGTLRVLTRSFESAPLAATVLIRDARGKRIANGEADAEGRYQTDIAPGDYVVTISAPGYRPHRREVRIERYGVAILNVDLHAQK